MANCPFQLSFFFCSKKSPHFSFYSMYYVNATHFLFAYFHPSLQCMCAAIAPHQSCHAATSGTVCTLGLSPSSPSSLPRSLLGPATLVMRAEYTIRACHTPTAGAAPLPRLGYRLKHLLINTDLPLLPLSTHTRMHTHAHTISSRWLLLAAFSLHFQKGPQLCFSPFVWPENTGGSYSILHTPLSSNGGRVGRERYRQIVQSWKIRRCSLRCCITLS